jgi:hypothetical protein
LAVAATVALVAGGLLVPDWVTAGYALALIGCVLALVWLARQRATLSDEAGADGERLPRWTVVAIPRSAALRESAMRAGDPMAWHVARHRWRWMAQASANRRTRLSDTFDYEIRRT